MSLKSRLVKCFLHSVSIRIYDSHLGAIGPDLRLERFIVAAVGQLNNLTWVYCLNHVVLDTLEL